MKFLLDHCVPRPFLRYLPGFEVQRAGQLGWEELSNGKLLAAAEEAGFCALITVDKGFANQQNMNGRKIAVLILDSSDTSVDGLIPFAAELLSSMRAIEPGTVSVLRTPESGSAVST